MSTARLEVAHPRRRRIGEWLADRALRGITRTLKKRSPRAEGAGAPLSTIDLPEPNPNEGAEREQS